MAQLCRVYDALYDGGVEHLLCRHEQGAAMAAIGYARATGKTGVCIATSGPGATKPDNRACGRAVRFHPVVAITGQVSAPFIGTDAFQEVDILGLSLACTKHSFSWCNHWKSYRVSRPKRLTSPALVVLVRFWSIFQKISS
ncbi:thiamine pyrophosphate-binding protein [Escherichia coli]